MSVPPNDNGKLPFTVSDAYDDGDGFSSRGAQQASMELVARATFQSLLAAPPRYLVAGHEVYVIAEQLPSFILYIGVQLAEEESEETDE